MKADNNPPPLINVGTVQYQETRNVHENGNLTLRSCCNANILDYRESKNEP